MATSCAQNPLFASTRHFCEPTKTFKSESPALKVQKLCSDSPKDRKLQMSTVQRPSFPFDIVHELLPFGKPNPMSCSRPSCGRSSIKHFQVLAFDSALRMDTHKKKAAPWKRCAHPKGKLGVEHARGETVRMNLGEPTLALCAMLFDLLWPRCERPKWPKKRKQTCQACAETGDKKQKLKRLSVVFHNLAFVFRLRATALTPFPRLRALSTLPSHP